MKPETEFWVDQRIHARNIRVGGAPLPAFRFVPLGGCHNAPFGITSPFLEHVCEARNDLTTEEHAVVNPNQFFLHNRRILAEHLKRRPIRESLARTIEPRISSFARAESIQRMSQYPGRSSLCSFVIDSDDSKPPLHRLPRFRVNSTMRVTLRGTKA
jgi:hypothetical protein